MGFFGVLFGVKFGIPTYLSESSNPLLIPVTAFPLVPYNRHSCTYSVDAK